MIPLDTKIMTSEDRIVQWYRYFNGKVYVSFSGGRDSTVLLNLVRSLYKDVPAVFVDTGLEFPEIKEFVKTFDNVIIIKPSLRFDEVIKKHGYPVISKEVSQRIYEYRHAKSEKHKKLLMEGREKDGRFKIPEKHKYLIDAPFKISHLCCEELKKKPMYKYQKQSGTVPYIGIRSEESSLRKINYSKYGCNAYEMKHPQSRPLMPWTRQDVQEYITSENLQLSSIYSKGYDRTGCMFCLFGQHLEDFKKIEQLKQTHPKHYEYIMYNIGFNNVIEFLKS